MILPNGHIEQGEDSGGVIRDCVSEYWDTFYKKCAKGNNSKKPILRHDILDSWTTIAKVALFSYKQTGYFPIVLCQSFLDYVMDDIQDCNKMVSNDDL